jgi:hypothetical protein
MLKNLQNFGVQEMNKHDIKDTEGVFFVCCFISCRI